MNHDASAQTIESNDDHTPTRISGQSARRAATWFNWGNIVAMIVPLPLAIFWTGLSMLVYALNKHHPNPKWAITPNGPPIASTAWPVPPWWSPFSPHRA